MMKKLLALLICVATVVSVLSGCSSYDPNEPVGSTLNMYLTEEIYDFDPMYAYRSEDALKMSSLLFTGLFTVNEKGKLEKELVKKYEIENDDEKDIYRIIITLKEAYWSDGNRVSAKDFLASWKRILNPTSVSDAAVLLYEIRNAYDAKNGNCSIDDIGVYAVDTETLQIEFDKEIDFEDFLYNLASPCLVPVRETVLGDENWAKKSSIVCNGPFIIREVNYGTSLTLERNSYYNRDREKDSIKKAVTPYRIKVNFTRTPAEQIEDYNNLDIDLVGNIAVDSRASYEKDATVANALSTLSCYFNLDNPIFADANTRKALSLAIDRQAIADKLVFADPATALVPSGVFEASSAKKSFRKVGGSYLNETADLDAAKALGKFNGSFSITVYDKEADVAVAEMLKSAWESLGFKVAIKKVSMTVLEKKTENKETTVTLCRDDYLEVMKNRDFDVLLTEISAIDTDAFSFLAPFAAGYSGRDIKFTVDSHEDPVHITGYNSEDYNIIINTAFAEKNVSKRSKMYLHEAEEKLMEDLPVLPIVFTKTAAIIPEELKGVSIDYFGNLDITKAKFK